MFSKSRRWRFCRVVEATNTHVKIHYERFKDKHNEWLHKSSERILVGNYPEDEIVESSVLDKNNDANDEDEDKVAGSSDQKRRLIHALLKAVHAGDESATLKVRHEHAAELDRSINLHWFT